MTRFAILAPQRSGSTWLRDLVRSHPRVSAAKEVFLDVARKESELLGDARGLRWVRTWRYLEALERRAGAEPRAGGPPAAFGFKAMYNHLDARPEILPFLAARGYRAIHLVRENLLEVHLSRLRAERTGVFHETVASADAATPAAGSEAGAMPGSESRGSAPLDLDPAATLRALRSLDRQVRRKRLALRLLPIRSLEVRYEALLARREEVMERVFRFLDLDPGEATLEVERAKLAREPVAARIRDPDSMRRALRGTPWAEFLER